jgi:hypothetical protein
MNTLTAIKQGQLAGQSHLTLAENLTEFPSEILELADSLEVLDLSNNRLRQLPDSFRYLKNLKIVFFTNNQFEEFPSVLSQCPKLSIVSFKGNNLTTIAEDALSPTIRWLILTHNALQALPESIGRLTKLQKLMLAGNRLTEFPPTLANCQHLELIRFSSNQLAEFPKVLLTLPKLSWIAYAGNPFCQAQMPAMAQLMGRSLPAIHWDELEVGEPLGQGASGVIYKGLWHSKGSDNGLRTVQEVAIKLFKSDMTSDGSPLDEMKACMVAGNHPNLVTVLGKLTGTPDRKAGLVFEMLPPTYTPLGNPPSFDSCTRDTYPTGTSFSPSTILKIAKGMASVMKQFHESGIMHGDVYAHNILLNDASDSMLSDFGAASFYDPSESTLGNALEKIEVRAFGCLLDDLLNHCEPIADAESPDAELISGLRRLQKDCVSSVWAQRPGFETILDAVMNVCVIPGQ